VLYAEVAVRSEAPYRRPFTYAVPDGLELRPGQGVLVPFGPRTLQGVVLALTDIPGFEGEIKPLFDVATEIPLIPAHLIPLARWMADYYLAPLFSCIGPLLPPGVERRARVRLFPVEGIESFSEPERRVLDRIQGRPGIDAVLLQNELKQPKLSALIETMAGRGLLRREYTLDAPQVGPRMVHSLRLTDAAGGVEVAGPIFRHLLQAGGILPLAAVRKLPEFSEAGLRRLLETGLAVETQERIYRDPLAGHEIALRPSPALTPGQEEALRQVLDPTDDRPRLLHGVTGSGKTEVYLAAAAATLTAGRQVLVLVPEISLTPQTIERFAGRFPGRVAVLHSGLSDGQRYDQWCGIREGRFDVVIGSRSAIFAPLDRPGLIVIDEEHEWTYKQLDPAPRYQTRDVAARLAALTGARLVLGSATPAVVSYYRAKRDRYRLVELKDRVRPSFDRDSAGPAPLPAVSIVDLSRELREGNRGIFSRELMTAMDSALQQKEQVLLFLNRRGAANFLLCRDCGHTPRCSRCAVTLTLHAEKTQLLCHQCGRNRRVPSACPRCHSPRIRRLGLGTERVVEEVERLYPAARVMRWDRDSAQNAKEHAKIYESLQRGDADVLVGTQMVAKGLDLPNVSLAAIVNADLSLDRPDFDASERAFQLFAQVAGRAGRRDRPGYVILQTYAPNNYAVRAAAAHDYPAFYEREIEYRRRTAYPPFSRLTRLVFTHSSERRVEEECRRLALVLRQAVIEGRATGAQIIGPTPCPVPRIRGRWRSQILLRAARPGDLLADQQLPPGWTIDVDPQSFT
jgi:primosomal protein N' (replication factor Y) (superfamily II helicase)